MFKNENIMTDEQRKAWEEALVIIDDNLGVENDIITNRFSTATKIVEFAQQQVEKVLSEHVNNDKFSFIGTAKDCKDGTGVWTDGIGLLSDEGPHKAYTLYPGKKYRVTIEKLLTNNQ